MVKKLLLFSTLLLITIFPNINANAITFSRNGIGCVYFWDDHQYCDTIQEFSYNGIPYFGANFSYTPDNNSTISATIVEYNNQSFCANNSSGGVLNVRFYHNYPFENSVFNFIQLGVDNVEYTCTTSLSLDGRYSDVSCPISHGFSNKTVGFKYRFNDLGFNFPFTSGFSNIVTTENCGISGGDIITNQNQNTQDIINNNNSNTQNIINNNNSTTNQIIQNNEQNTQDIIDNQNQNTQDQIESQQVCTEISNNNYNGVKTNGYLDNSGNVVNLNDAYITDYIPLSQNSTITLSKKYSNSYISNCFYDSNKTLISCKDSHNYDLGNYTIPPNSSYVRLSYIAFSQSPILVVKSCQNGNQAVSDSINGLNDTLKSDTPPDTENQLNDLDSSLISDTPITDLITLPISLLNSYISGFSGTCSPYNFGNLLGTDLIFPCLNLQEILGSNLWNNIDSLCSIFLIYNIAMLMIQAFEGFTSLRDDYESLYQPRHADTGYQPKHGGGN